jgi:hypothetical protein
MSRKVLTLEQRLEVVKHLDDELLEMMTVKTKQTTISDFFQPV